MQADAGPVLHEFSLTARDRRELPGRRVRAHADVAQLVNVIVVIAPPGNIVSTQHLAGFLELIATSCMERSTPCSPADEGKPIDMSSDIANLKLFY